MNGVNQAVSGGIGGFLAFFLLACALWLLMRNMNKRLRNVKYDEELESQRSAVEAGQDTLTRPPRPDAADASDVRPAGDVTASGTAAAPGGAGPLGGTGPGHGLLGDGGAAGHDDPTLRRGVDPLPRASAGH